MAFTAEQEADIRLYLGYPLLFNDDLYFLVSALALIGADPIKQTLVETQLEKLQEIDEQVAQATQAAGIKKADEVEFFNSTGQVSGYIQQGKRYISRISTILSVPVLADYYSGYGYGAGKSGNVMAIG